jgi:hypothetical protein
VKSAESAVSIPEFMFLRSASFIERRKEPFVHRKEQSLESFTQKLKENHRTEATVVTVVRKKN